MNKLIQKITKKSYFILAFSILFISFYSCVPSQQLIRNENKIVPKNFNSKISDSLNSAKINWKNFFSDANLVALIDTALVNNQELNIISQQINRAKNEIGIRKGEYLPFVNIYAGSEFEKVGEFTRNGAVERNLNIRENEEFPEPLPNFSVGLAASWELDVWKKLRMAKKQQL